jgi:hypothetical protein
MVSDVDEREGTLNQTLQGCANVGCGCGAGAEDLETKLDVPRHSKSILPAIYIYITTVCRTYLALRNKRSEPC